MPLNPPSFRFPFATLSKLPPEAQAAHLATFNALTDIYQSIAQQKVNSTTSTTNFTETVTGVTASSSASGVTSFNGMKGAVTYFPDLALVNNQTGVTAYTTQNSDNGALVVLNDASSIAVGLNYSVNTNWSCVIANYGGGTATLTPTLIPSGSTSTISYPGHLSSSSMPLSSGFAALIYFDGQNFFGIPISISGSAGTVTAVTGVAPIVSSGGTTPAISVNIATTTTFGVVKPDNSTITITGGVLSASGSGGYSLGGSLSNSNVALGPGAGTGATLSAVSGLDGVHRISITFGTSPVNGSAIWTTTFTASRGHVTYPQIQCVAVSVGGTFIEVSSSSASATSYSAFIDPSVTPVSGTSYIFNVSCP